MKKATFDPARNLDLYFRKGMNGSKVFRFFDANEDDYDLTGQTFAFRSGFAVTLVVDENTINFSIDEDEVISRGVYFWSLVNTTTGQTWLCGNAIFTDTQANEITETENITINLTGEIIEVTISLSGSDNYRGDWDPTGDVLPTTAVSGYRWRLTENYKSIGAGSTIEAAVDNPASDSDWNFYVTIQL